MILMPQIFDVTANENARYKRNELELHFLAQDPVRGLCFYARSGQGWIQGQAKCGSDGTPRRK